MLRGTSWVCVLATSLAAQTIDVAKLPKELARDRAVDVAWAAHHVRAAKHKELIAQVQRALGTWRRKNGNDARVACLHLLDALIALDAKVPAGELVELIDDATCSTAAFVLLAREPKTNEAELFSLFQRDLASFRPPEYDGMQILSNQRDIRTVVVGDILAIQAPTGFAAMTAPLCNWSLRLSVIDPGSMFHTRMGQCPSGEVCVEPHPGWPRRPAFGLQPVDGVRSEVQQLRILRSLDYFVAREDRPAKFWTIPAPPSRKSILAHPVQWLTTASGVAPSPMRVAIVFRDNVQFLSEAVDARDRLQACVDAMRTKLVAKGALRAEDAAKLLPERIEVEITDKRIDAKAALPKLPPPKQTTAPRLRGD